jgi:microcompartment protein CcmK/EutM
MKMARVTGTVVCTRKHPSVDNTRMLLIQPINERKEDVGSEVVALDAAQAGPKDIVYYVLSRESTLALDEQFAPIDAVVTGVVDLINVESTKINNIDKIFIKD